jgi:uncharacterized protein YjlB
MNTQDKSDMQSQSSQFISQIFHNNGAFPNNENLPLVILKSPLKDIQITPEYFEKIFREHGWPAAWRNGLYDFHHYHSKAHEVLGVYSGWTRACFGGPQGKILQAEKGDVIIIPAGVSHCNKEQSPDFKVVGGYFASQPWDMMYGKQGERPQADRNISQVCLPNTDPVFGSDGPLLKLWT